MKPASSMTQAEINEFCSATSAMYFAIVRSYAARTGDSVMLPSLLCPKGRCPCVGDFDEALLDEAEKFLLRMGFIGECPRGCRTGPTED